MAGLLAQSQAEEQARSGVAAKPNVIFVLADQWRAQATGYAGDPNVKTPNLDRLATQGINMANALKNSISNKSGASINSSCPSDTKGN